MPEAEGFGTPCERDQDVTTIHKNTHTHTHESVHVHVHVCEYVCE